MYDVLKYQKAYFRLMHNINHFDYGYYTMSSDIEYLNSNSIICEEATEDAVASICMLLANGLESAKIQLPCNNIISSDYTDTLYLLQINSVISNNREVELIKVDNANINQFIKLSNSLQIQEYGKIYKQNFNNSILNNRNIVHYMIKYKEQLVGEFVYLKQLNAIENLIILKKYHKLGIGRATLNELIFKYNSIMLSADNSSIDYYKQFDYKLIDSQSVDFLYGNKRTLLMYLTLCI